MTHKDGSNIEPDAPDLLKNIKWILQHGHKNWKLILIALLVLFAYLAYNIISPNSITTIQQTNKGNNGVQIGTNSGTINIGRTYQDTGKVIK